jgi:drug/metabolite transporter (DMT)-like permease
MRWREWASFAALCGIWGSTWAAIRVLVVDVPPLRAAAVRFVIAGVVALAWMLAARKRMPRGDEWRAIAVLSVTMIGLPFGIIFWAEQTVASGTAALIYAALPLFISLMAPLVQGGVTPPRRALAAMCVGLGGLALLLEGALRVDRHQVAGTAAMLVSLGLSAWSTLYAKRTIAGKGTNLDPTMSAAWQFLFAAVWLGVGSAALERGQVGHWTGTAWAAELFLSVLGSVVTFSLYFRLLQRWEAYRVGATQLTLPVVAVVEGAVLLHEPLPWQMVVAMATILGSVAVVMRAGMRDEEPVSIRSEV